MTQEVAAQPVSPRERILALDVLRGFAMVGVLVAYCMWSLGTAPEETWTRADRWLGDFVNFAVDGKFYTTLSFLFGLGFSIQLSRAANDAAAVETYCRRLTVLAAIGLLHALLLRNGDILLPYALTGFFLIPFRNSSDRTMLTAAVIAVIVNHVGFLLWKLSSVPFPQRPNLQGLPYLVENMAWVRYWYSLALFEWPIYLTLFLFGFLAGRHHLLARLRERPGTLKRIAGAGLVAGTILYFSFRALSEATSSVIAALRTFLFTLHCWCFASAYAALLLLALRTSSGTRILTPLSAIGRMALTNYLSQAAIIVPLCLAFGWFDTFRPTTSLLLSAAILFLVQLPFSLAWLRHFQFGPAEWVWRLFTYGRMPPLRRTIATAVPQ